MHADRQSAASQNKLKRNNLPWRLRAREIKMKSPETDKKSAKVKTGAMAVEPRTPGLREQNNSRCDYLKEKSKKAINKQYNCNQNSLSLHEIWKQPFR